MKSDCYIPEAQIRELERAGNKIVTNLNKGQTQILLKAARKVQKRIKEKAPLGPTGNLKKSTYAKALPPTVTQRAVAFAGVRARKAPHAHLVEYGHGGPHPAPPHPFIRPAWDSIKDEIQRDISCDFKNNVEGSV